jgi:two-component system vancomycin resistance associated response regulator VraR
MAQARSIGVDSFWYKDGQKDSILEVMERTMAGEHIYPDKTPLIHIGNTTNHEFTERELDVLKELTTGDTNTEIAERLHLSVATVKSHIQHLMEKTGFKTRTELVSEARSHGIVIKNKKD